MFKLNLSLWGALRRRRRVGLNNRKGFFKLKGATDWLYLGWHDTFIGSASKVTEVLNGARKLSLAMIRKLNEGFGISIEVLICAPALKAKSLPKKSIYSRIQKRSAA